MSVPTIFFVHQIGYICIMKRIVVIVIIICSALGVFSQNIVYSFSMREKWTPTWVDKNDDNGLIVDATQYVPIALPWAMKAIGQPTRSAWGRMSISQGLGVVMMGGSVKLLKNVVGDMRPDATDCTSFPSGHTAWAFLGATMIERELGWRSPWYTFGAYTFASAVAMQRVVDKRHFPIDVAGGAAIGVIAGHLGYFIGDKIFGDICHSSVEFEEYCKKIEQYDIILTDREMGAFSGLDVLKKVKEMNQEKKVVLMTARSEYNKDVATQKGFDNYIRKPFSIKDLADLLNTDINIVDTEKKESRFSFDFPELCSMFENDDESITNILKTFVETTSDNLMTFNKIINDNNFDDAVNLCHKMCPMFVQLNQNESAEFY